jgi:hypothetical protein
MAVVNAFSKCNGDSAFSSWEAVSPIKVVIKNREPLTTVSDVSLRAESHI